MRTNTPTLCAFVAAVTLVVAPVAASAQTCGKDAGANGNGAPASLTEGTRATFLNPAPPDYIIGADDVLVISFWRDESMSGEVVVRPDGKISLPLINDVQAAGFTPLELCEAVTEASKKYLEAPAVSVVVKQINSRRVYITGSVGRPGPYNTTGPMTVVQLITLAGGLNEFADKKNILIIRTEAGRKLSYKVNFEDISKGKNLGQDIELKPGDIVIVR